MANPLWLHTLVVVHEAGSFTRAADRLDLTQAAVSQHISRLEAEFGPLLLRKPRQLELIPRGLVLLDFARQQAQARLSDDDPHHGAIPLSTPGSIGLLLYPLLLDQQQAHPGLTIHHRFAPTPDIVQAVLAGRSDLGLVDQPPEHPSIAAEPFAREPLCLVVPNDGEEPSWQHLCKLGFIDHPDGRSMAQRLLGRRYPGQCVDEIPLRGFTHQIGLILEPVARGLGFTVLPRFAITACAQQEQIRVIQSRIEVIDTLWLINRAEWPLPAHHQRLVAVLKQRVAAHGTLLQQTSR
ncbi:LysR family transcriptional regulator [Aeromonas veronii]|nr:LysR family transcriptional regulator [Aeromonas veronii]